MAQRGKDTCPWSHSQQAVELGFKPGSVSLQRASKAVLVMTTQNQYVCCRH